MLEIGLLSFIVYMSGDFAFSVIINIIIESIREASKLYPIINIFYFIVGLVGGFFLLIDFNNFIGKLGSGLFLAGAIFSEFVTIEIAAPHFGIFHGSFESISIAFTLDSVIFYVSLALVGIAFYTQGRKGGFYVLLASSLLILNPFYDLLNALATSGRKGLSSLLNFGAGFAFSDHHVIYAAEIIIGGVRYSCAHPLLAYIIFEIGTVYSYLLDDVIFIIGFLMILKDLISRKTYYM